MLKFYWSRHIHETKRQVVSKYLSARTDLHEGERHAERKKKMGKGEGGREKGEGGREKEDTHSICHLWDFQAWTESRMLAIL